MSIYHCHECDAVQCKLWRPSYVFADDIKLICWRCLESKGYDIKYGQKYESDQIYDPLIDSTCWVPAVMDFDGSFWGYTSVPLWWCSWWRDLPNKKDDCTFCLGSGKTGKYKCHFCKGSGNR